MKPFLLQKGTVIRKNKNFKLFLVQQPTIADLAVMDLVQMIEDPDDNLYRGLDRCDARFLLLRHFPLLSEHAALTAQALEGVAAWLEQRPEDARVVEKVLLVTKTWETVYSIKHRREDE